MRWSWLVLLTLLTLLTTACTARVVGFSSPLLHDYGGVQWLPLVEAVEQPFVTGPGYSDAVANDATTTPAQFQARLAALPLDARTGSLVELRVGLRHDGDERGGWDTGARLQLAVAPEHDLRFPEGQRAFGEWPESDGWLPEGSDVGQTFVSRYPMLAGITVRVATFGGDLSAGDAVVGDASAAVYAQPVGDEAIATLASGTIVPVSGATEGRAQMTLADGRSGFVPLDAFASVPAPARRPPDLVFRLASDDGRVEREVLIPASELHDNAHLDVRFEPIPDSAGRAFTFSFAPADPTRSGGVTFRLTGADAYPDGAWTSRGNRDGRDLVFRPIWEPAAPLLDLPVDGLPRDGDWVVLEEPPAVPSGVPVVLRLVPGTRPDATALRYGVTSDRAPYGAWRATGDVSGTQPGALLLQTTWERDVDLRGIVRDGLRHLRATLRADLTFTLAWLVLLALPVAGAVVLRRGRGAI